MVLILFTETETTETKRTDAYSQINFLGLKSVLAHVSAGPGFFVDVKFRKEHVHHVEKLEEKNASSATPIISTIQLMC